ncbi:MAG TPA: 3-oxoadipate enol-lactonase [Caulobacter sp.]|nr:3-oxoadipate enol-lactonase [Caulobacter sp.]
MPFANHAGARLYWRQEGSPDKPALLLLSSIGTDQSLWDLAAPHLLDDFRILRMDTRGHGASDAPTGPYSLAQLAGDALSVLDAAGADQSTICGVSLGGMIALRLALDAPERVAGLAIACTSAEMDRAAWQARIDTVTAEGTGAIADMAMQRFFPEAFRRSHPRVVDTVRGGLLATDPTGYAGCCAAIRDMDILSRLGAIAAPTLVIHGLRDISTPFVGHGDRIAAAIPGARSAALDTGHLPCLEAPGGFAALVRRFHQRTVHGNVEDDAADALYAAGLRTRRKVLGDAWVDASLESRTDFNADFQAMITRCAWREVWSRPGLDHRTRRLLVVAMTASLGRWEEFRLHVRSGLDAGGFTVDELKEVLMQVAIYAGVPAANTAFAEAGGIVESWRARFGA